MGQREASPGMGLMGDSPFGDCAGHMHRSKEKNQKHLARIRVRCVVPGDFRLELNFRSPDNLRHRDNF